MLRARLLASVTRMVAVVGLCACLGCTGTAHSSTSAGETGSHNVLGPAIDHRLWHVAERAAQGMNGRIKSAQAVKSQHAAAVRLTSGAIVSGNRDVWAIQIEGVHEFVCRQCSRPLSARPPSGRFITIVIDAKTFESSDWGLASQSVDLSELGTIFELHS